MKDSLVVHRAMLGEALQGCLAVGDEARSRWVEEYTKTCYPSNRSSRTRENSSITTERSRLSTENAVTLPTTTTEGTHFLPWQRNDTPLSPYAPQSEGSLHNSEEKQRTTPASLSSKFRNALL